MKDRVTGDDPVHYALCGRESSLAMLAVHMQAEHDIDPDEIADAPIVDLTDEP